MTCTILGTANKTPLSHLRFSVLVPGEIEFDELPADYDAEPEEDIMPSSASAATRARPTVTSNTGGAPAAKKPKSTGSPVIDILNSCPYNYNIVDGSFVAYYT